MTDSERMGLMEVTHSTTGEASKPGEVIEAGTGVGERKRS